MTTFQRGGSAILKAILGRQHAADAARASLNRLVEAGPPSGSSITQEGWRDWHQYGFLVCPRRKITCSEPACGIGASAMLCGRSA